MAAANSVPTDWLVMSASRMRIRLGGMICPSVPEAQMMPQASARVVAAPQHAGQRQQAERHDGGADDAGGRAHQHADEDDADAEPAAQRAGGEPDHVHQLFGELGFLQHHAHEHEQRNGEQRVIGHHAEDAVRQQVEQVRCRSRDSRTRSRWWPASGRPECRPSAERRTPPASAMARTSKLIAPLRTPGADWMACASDCRNSSAKPSGIIAFMR